LAGAYGSEEEATFLATQQVDEARHMQFYARFQDEVIADPSSIAAHVDRSRRRLSPAFEVLFDEALVAAHAKLLATPADVAAKVEGYGKIHHDEHRHIGYGIWFLRESVRRDPALAESLGEKLRQLLPAVADSLTPLESL
jgi:ribonucleoside-diphosphate reductase beta chain